MSKQTGHGPDFHLYMNQKSLLLFILSLIYVWLLLGPAWGGEKSVGYSLETIVIDPGHGGHDRGVEGLSGLQEKDLCLALAQQLAGMLKQQLGVRVILTRNDDYSVSLYERAAIANHQRADLFISLHFNADFSGQQQGMEIYVLEQVEGSAEVSSSSTGVSHTVGTRWNEAQLGSLEQSQRLAESIYQQGIISQGIISQGIISQGIMSQGITSRGITSPYIKNIRLSSAPLLVLRGASMPAVLVELAYLSHHEEEKGLWDQGYKSALVEILYQGILSYKRELVNKPEQLSE